MHSILWLLNVFLHSTILKLIIHAYNKNKQRSHGSGCWPNLFGLEQRMAADRHEAHLKIFRFQIHNISTLVYHVQYVQLASNLLKTIFRFNPESGAEPFIGFGSKITTDIGNGYIYSRNHIGIGSNRNHIASVLCHAAHAPSCIETKTIYPNVRYTRNFYVFIKIS